MGKKVYKYLGGISSIDKTAAEYMVQYKTGESTKLNILNNHVFKFYMSPTGNFKEYPTPINPEDKAKINIKSISDYNKQAFEYSTLTEGDNDYTIDMTNIVIKFDKIDAKMTVLTSSNEVVLKEKEPLCYNDFETKQVLHENKNEYFFGGGMQNGRFTHKGEFIKILNTSNWVNGGVTSPCPFYWSTKGYGILRNTWQPGIYDFGCKTPGQVTTIHNGNEFDAFFFTNDTPENILGDYYELTGCPIFMPEYAFYEVHLNTFNRDYWVRVTSNTTRAILFEDGQYYKRYQPKEMKQKEGILESLNGENDNYQFSARAMIDRYKMHNVPLGWFIPNDGYGSGYGQTDSLDGDINNLKEFHHYSKENGVEVALWTESNLVPPDPDHPKKGDRDLAKEVVIAGIVALKCDVAWIGSGYSFGLNAVENATNIFVKETKGSVRPMIIMVNGWAGTQRYAGIWSGDQYGGQWEYIRFHIPTYIGAGLSGFPVIGSDMDGIYGGNDKEVNIRDFQWKAFTPLQLNMDGWGSLPKTPFSFDYEATSINRAYLKMKTMLMPYNYTIGYESTYGLPMVRAMFLEFPGEISAYTKDSQYQFMWGPKILVAPVYKSEMSISGDSVRNNIYLPDANQVWTELLTGDKYKGNKIYNNFKTPLWKIPVFVKDGAILPMVKSNNNPKEVKRHNRMFMIYPNGISEFEVYEDDCISSDYLKDHFAKTKVIVIGPKINEEGTLVIQVSRTNGVYSGMIKERNTIFKVKASKDVETIRAVRSGQDFKLQKVNNINDFKKNDDVFYFTEEHVINKFLLEFELTELKQKFLLIKIKNMDVTSNDIHIKIKDYSSKCHIFGNINNLDKSVPVPVSFTVLEEKSTSSSLTLSWIEIDCMYYEIERDGIIFSNIYGSSFMFDDFKPSTQHSFKIRSVRVTGFSKWSYTIIAETNEDPLKNVVKDIKVSCNIPCEPCQEVTFLVNYEELHSIWHTDWNRPCEANIDKRRVIELSFDLKDVYKIDKVQYVPRDDCGNGTFLRIRYRVSSDGRDWTNYSNDIHWEWDSESKTILLNGIEMQYMHLQILDSVGGFGAGKAMYFYKVVQ